MMQGDPTALAVMYIVFKALVAIFLWGVAAIGYLWSPLSMIERIFAALSACFLVAAYPMTDQIGFVASALFIGWNWYQTRQK